MSSEVETSSVVAAAVLSGRRRRLKFGSAAGDGGSYNKPDSKRFLDFARNDKTRAAAYYWRCFWSEVLA
jgi:hypothetical protein